MHASSARVRICNPVTVQPEPPGPAPMRSRSDSAVPTPCSSSMSPRQTSLASLWQTVRVHSDLFAGALCPSAFPPPHRVGPITVGVARLGSPQEPAGREGRGPERHRCHSSTVPQRQSFQHKHKHNHGHPCAPLVLPWCHPSAAQVLPSCYPGAARVLLRWSPGALLGRLGQFSAGKLEGWVKHRKVGSNKGWVDTHARTDE